MTEKSKGSKVYPWEKPIDKRKGPDFWVKSLTWFGMFGWFIILSGLVVLDKAKPKTETFLDRKHNVEVVEQLLWNKNLSEVFFYLMILGLLVSTMGLCINSTRKKRKNDEYRLSLILVGLISLIGLFFFAFGIK
jgi:uncharacterized membrane protein YhaH (DUF805 family)